MTTAFTRQLGFESGVQLNPLRDDSEIPVLDNSDQVFAIAMRATRGRIDKPFKVDRGNVLRKLGAGEQIRTSALNEAWVHVVEALNNGAYEAVVQRLTVSAAPAIKWATVSIARGATFSVTANGGVITAIAVTDGGFGYTSAVRIQITSAVGTGAAATATVANGVITAVTVTSGGTGYVEPPTTVTAVQDVTFTVASAAPSSGYLFSVKHLECHNDGIILEFWADEKKTGGVAEANDRITLRILDSAEDPLYEFTGSLDVDATDDYGNSAYLPDVVAAQTDVVVVVVGATGDDAAVYPDEVAYGYSTSGLPNWSTSAVLTCFTEGSTSYATADYTAARLALQHTPHNYAYISAGGTQSAGLLAQLAQLAFDTNRQLRFDVPGSLDVDAAIAYVEQLAMGEYQTAHLMHAFWCPLKTEDPAGINPKGYFGASTLNIAYACGRNAQTNAKGFAPKNYPIAGKAWPLNRRNVTPMRDLSDQQLSALAKAKINPVLWETYSGGGRYVFRDSLTCALVESSLKKLIAVADMSTSIDEAVTRAGHDLLQLPMQVALKRMFSYLTDLFEGAQASGWLVVSNAPEMGGKAWKFEVKPNAVRPYDRMDVSYWLRYDGTVRQIFVTQTLTR